MTVRVNKPSFNIREKLSELGRKFGLKGSELAAAETVQEARDIVSAGRKNMVINGAMRVAQRGTSATSIGTAVAYNTVDRWRFADSQNPSARFTQTQSTDAPPGFGNSHKFEVTTTTTSVTASQMQYTDQFIEAQDLQSLAYGTSNAKKITLSFWVKSSVAQTFGVGLSHEDGGGSYGVSYTVNSADTWEYKTLTFNGNTSTAINNDNGRGLRVRFGLSAGSNNVNGSDATSWTGAVFGQHDNGWLSTSGATWQITGVQLEVGRNATEFEHRPYGEELALCQRYYEKFSADCGNGGYATVFMASKHNNTVIVAQPIFRVPKRETDATMSWAGDFRMYNHAIGSDITMSSVNNSQLSTHGGYVVINISSNTMANGDAYRVEGRGDTSAYVAFSSEL